MNFRSNAIRAVIFASFLVFSGLFQSFSKAETGEYIEFPSNDTKAFLALTAQGGFVKMSYTPATYEIRLDPSKEYVELEIYDAILKEQSGSEDVNRQGANPQMKLAFPEEDSGWKIKCGSGIDIAKPDVSEILVNILSVCQFKEKDWSGTLQIYPATGKSNIIMKTAWDDSIANHYANTLHEDLINTFKFRTRNGSINLAATNTTDIKFIPGVPYDFRNAINKIEYEPTLNWTVLYNSGPTSFEFDIDVKGKTEVVLFDKDGDASSLHGPSTPNDETITMEVRWNDGEQATPITTSPEWTNFNQTNHGTFLPADHIPGETNSYSGPSGDTANDSNGIKSIQWYRIPVGEQKAESIKVTWKNFGSPNNGFGFASTSTVAPKCNPGINCPEDLEAPPEDPLDICDPDDELCLEALEKCDGNLKCLEELKECNGDPVCIEDLEEEYDPTIPKCRESGYLRACITSTPFPDPHPDSYLDKGDPITYHITLKNISSVEQPVALTNLNLGFNPPTYTTLDLSHHSEIIPEEGTGAYTGKGPGRFDLIESLNAGQTFEKNLIVQLDEDTLLDDYDITTENRIVASATNNSSVTLKPLIHHVGEGAVKVEVTRCYAFDYYGGEFQCNISCSTIEPGTKVTVRDTLTNKGGSTAYNHTYFPPPLSSSFDYEPNSIRIDHPISGISVPNDGQTFPPSEGITVPGPIESNNSRTVFFGYYVPDDLLETDPPSEDEEQDGKCYPKETEEGAWSGSPQTRGPEGQEGSPFSPISYEIDCPPEENSNEEKNGLICVKVEENPKLNAVLSAIPSPDNPVYQGSVITYILRVTNTTNQPVANLIIEGFIPPMATCASGNCNGLNLMNPPDLVGKGTYEYSFSVQVLEDAGGSSIVHAGQKIIYKGDNEQIFEGISNPVIHELKAEPIPTGHFWHDIRLTRRTVLNTNEESKLRQTANEDDDGDTSEVIHAFGFSGIKKQDPSKQHVYPYLSNGESMNSGTHSIRCDQISPYYYGNTKIYEAPPSAWFTIYKQHPSSSSVYDSYVSVKEPGSLLTFQVTTDLPQDRPKLKNLSGRGSDAQDIFTLTIRATTTINDGIKNGIDALNYFMLHGGESENEFLKNGNILFSQEKIQNTLITAVRDGQANGDAGKVKATNTFSVVEEIWSFAYQGKLDTLSCWIEGCDNCGAFPISIPTYKWQRQSQKNLQPDASDRDYITALSSVAWLQTKNGNMGFGEAFWRNIPQSGDPNLVNLGDRFIASQMKLYSPPTEYNADLLLFSPDGSDPLTSRMGSLAKIQSQGIPQGFIDPLGSGQKRLSRGDAYDRAEYPRDYMDDLLKKQVYGKVVHLNANRPAGFTLTGNTLVISGPVIFESDTIYSYKGDVILGSPAGNPSWVISGGRARLVIEGNVRIASNIKYSSHSGTDLSQIPSLRLHTTGNIFIDPGVTDIELMMLSENEFHSGKSDRQLRILGDVIAYKTFWERTPLNETRDGGEVVNKPSEIIYEDFRKYLLTPPGDKKLPDIGHFWREVSSGGGK